MTISNQRDWVGDEWQTFSRRLVQMRHGAQNVQDVPSKVKGDAGIEFFTTDGCCYQCYAPEETANTAKAASAMKRKATRDLPKLINNVSVIASLLGTIKIRRWILLCPFLDDKEVIAHVASKAVDVVEAKLDYIDDNFHALVHCQIDFENELQRLRLESHGIPIRVSSPTEYEVEEAANMISNRLDEKLERGFPQIDNETRKRRKLKFIRSHLISSNALDQLKLEFPDLWESSWSTVQAEEMRLETIGPSSGNPNEQLKQELERLERSLSTQLPTLDQATITSIANGTLGTWLIECPLDFAKEAET